MNKIVFIFFFISAAAISQKRISEHTSRQGQVAFFSYTDVENIEAVNNQTLCALNIDTGDITAQILMKAFVFENSLMHTHFNDSYIESDLYPKALFTGSITDFDPIQESPQARMVKGKLTIKEITVPVEMKVIITRTPTSYILVGNTEVRIKDFKINIPKLFESYIAKMMQITFNFEFKVSDQ